MGNFKSVGVFTAKNSMKVGMESIRKRWNRSFVNDDVSRVLWFVVFVVSQHQKSSPKERPSMEI